jgi:hypothetical protein
LHSTSRAVDAEPTISKTTSQNVPINSRDSTQAAGNQSNDQRFVEISEILEFSKAIKFVPTLKELDSIQAGGHGRGARETVAWFHGMRSFNGHPQLVWPTPNMVLKQFGSAHAWAVKVSDRTLPNGKLNKSSVALLVNRFNTLQAISKFIVETCPQQYRSNNGSPDYQGALQHAIDMDVSRGSASFNSWWDRVRVNRSARDTSLKLLHILPASKTKIPSLSEKDVQDITKYTNEALNASKQSTDHLGESHIIDGRQRFTAAEKLDLVEEILGRAGSSIKLLIKNQPQAGYLTSEWGSYSDENLISILTDAAVHRASLYQICVSQKTPGHNPNSFASNPRSSTFRR